MRRNFVRGLTWMLLSALLAGVIAPAQAALPGPVDRPNATEAQRTRGNAGEQVPGRYIVTFRGNVIAARAVSDLRRRHSIAVDRVYDRVLRGFAATLSPAQVRALQADPRVLQIEPDIWVEALDVPLATGVDRIGADDVANGAPPTRAGSPVAVLDTGVAEHPDLIVAGGVNCTYDGEAGDARDLNGHGTHVAGTVGGAGGTGVAPGTPIYAVKVLGDTGSGYLSWVVCGLNWVVRNHAALGIVAVNLSLGAPDKRDESAGRCQSSSLHRAICATREAGIHIVVAAGNDNENAENMIPAKYSQVITVAAMADLDGCAGGLAGRADDRKASWSNYGKVVDIIAPGARIVSTVPYGTGYDRYSGTSMAAPHVTGAVALGWDPATGPRTRGISGFGSRLGLVRLSANVTCWHTGPDDPTENPTITVRPRVARPGENVRVNLRGYDPGDTVRILLNGDRVDTVTVDATGAGGGRFRVPGGASPPRYIVRGIGAAGGSDSVRLRVND